MLELIARRCSKITWLRSCSVAQVYPGARNGRVFAALPGLPPAEEEALPLRQMGDVILGRPAICAGPEQLLAAHRAERGHQRVARLLGIGEEQGLGRGRVMPCARIGEAP